ncbi:uncharacterized protein LOC141691505 [Apium graveolens]|uniref:uncharacterized protein LOC141691505 n=1 Tax=Apium graveolens TaxID=4045 RepID=UPI003D79506E
MKVFLQAYNLWDTIEPKDPKAAIDGKTDKRPMAMIYQSISEELLLMLAERKTTKEALGEPIGEEYVVKKILRAVPTKFLQIASTLEQFGDLKTMSIEEFIGSLKAQEERISGQEWSKHDASSGGKLLLTREEWLQRSNRGGNSTRGGHDRSDRSKVKCFNYGAYGHFSAECRKPRRDKIQRREVNLTLTNDDEPALLMAMTEGDRDGMIIFREGEKLIGQEAAENMWYLDNGASNHMMGCPEKFEKLDKTIRGQAPRAWYSKLNKCLLRLGFIKCPYEHAVYTRKDWTELLLVGVYVDDLIITGTSVSVIVKFKGEMSREFDMTDLGKLSYYLGLEVAQ